MPVFQRRPLATAVLAASLSLCAALAQAQLVNGSLTGPISNGGVPTGWTVLEGSPDTMDATSNVGVAGSLDFGALPSATPNGGTWVGIGSSAGFIETFSQTVAGLTVGATYTLSWYAGNFGYSPNGFGYVNPNAINALIDGASVGTGSTLALGSAWYAESVNFVATATSHALSFNLATSATSYMSIDGIALTPAVPEPQTWALMLAGLVGVGVVSRRRFAQRSAA